MVALGATASVSAQTEEAGDTEVNEPASAPVDGREAGVVAPTTEAPAEDAPVVASETSEDAPVESAVPPDEEQQTSEDDGGEQSSAEGLLELLSVHGFASQGFIVTTANNYLADSDDGSFELAEVGLNLTAEPVEHLRIGVQLFARDLGPIGNYDARFDWFYADYRFEDWLGIRVGRSKVPFGLYNEENDVDVAHAPILLPQSVYPTSSRDFLLAQTGVELYGLGSLGDAGTLDYRAYAGTVFADFEQTPGSPFAIVGVDWPYLFGGRLMWELPVDGLRAGGSVQIVRLETDLLETDYRIVTDPMTMMDDVIAVPRPISADLTGVLWVASAEYSAHDLLVAAEYSRWHVSIESSDQMLLPDRDTVSERLYGMIAYRFAEWFQTSFYYSLYFPDTDDRSGRAQRQQDFALTLRFDINDYWLVKAEAHYMNGTAALSPALNGGVPNDRLTRDWAVFLVKTTAYF
jgi:hypothetical protein